MSKIFYLLLVSLVFFACSSDDDIKGSDSIVGKWSYQKITVEVNTNDPATTVEIKEKLLNDRERQGGIEFTEDLVYKYYDPVDNKIYSGTYYFEGNKLYICFTDKEGKECDQIAYTLNGSLLDITYDETEWMKREYPNANVTSAKQKISYFR